MPKVYVIFRDGYDNVRIQGVYDDHEYAENTLAALMEDDRDQEYTWSLVSYDLKSKPATEN